MSDATIGDPVANREGRMYAPSRIVTVGDVPAQLWWDDPDQPGLWAVAELAVEVHEGKISLVSWDLFEIEGGNSRHEEAMFDGFVRWDGLVRCIGSADCWRLEHWESVLGYLLEIRIQCAELFGVPCPGLDASDPRKEGEK